MPERGTLSEIERKPAGWAGLPRPVVALAPMDGITDSAYRRIVRRLHPDVVLFSEFTSAEGWRRSATVRERLDFLPEEQPYFVQLFGSDPAAFAEAARALEQQGVMGIDINMGCPARKIVASQHGSGLMRDPARACRIAEAVAGACALPVSVKTRLGWNDAHQLIPFARSLVDAGVSLITVHGRTYDKGFSGKADWAPIYRLKTALGIPVLGNGDVAHRAEGMAKLGNLDGFMIGRAAIGNPWVFGATPHQRQPTWEERAETMAGHYLLMRESRPEWIAVKEFRKHLAEYVRGFPAARALRRELMAVRNEEDLLRRIESLAWADTEIPWAS